MTAIFFTTAKDFREWLIENHDTSNEVWIGFYKKASDKKSISYKEALDEALCFGWIDGIRKLLDHESYQNRFTKRRAKSTWSKVNVAHVERLTKEDKMMKSGLLQVEMAKKDGRWEKAYSPQSNFSMPEEFLKLLKENQKAYENYQNLSKKELYPIYFRIQNSANEKNRLKVIEKIITLLENKELKS